MEKFPNHTRPLDFDSRFCQRKVSFDRVFHCVLPYSLFSVCWAMLLTRWSFLFKVAKLFEKSLRKIYSNARQIQKTPNTYITKTMYIKKNLTSGLNACRLERCWIMVSSSPNMVCRLIIKISKQQKRLYSIMISVQLRDHLHCTVSLGVKQKQRSNSGSRVSEMLCSHHNVFPGSSFEPYLSWWLEWKGIFGKKQTETWHSAVGGS